MERILFPPKGIALTVKWEKIPQLSTAKVIMETHER